MVALSTLRIVGYARVSSREQAEENNALEYQIARLIGAGATEIIKDVETGSSNSRPGFVSLLDLIKTNSVQEVVVTRIDRLSRKLKTVIELRDIFESSSCNLRALDNNIDLSTPTGKFHFSLLGSLAEKEVDELSFRIKKGIEARRKVKRVSTAPLGYKIVDGKLQLNTDPVLCSIASGQELSYLDLAKDAIASFLEKQSLSGGAKAYNLKYGLQRFGAAYGQHKQGRLLGWTTQGFKNFLYSPVLRGHTYFPKYKEIYYDTHDAILSEQQYVEIVQIVSHNKTIKGYGARKKKPLTGLVICANCGRNCGYRSAKRTDKNGITYDYAYYRCLRSDGGNCNSKDSTRIEIIEKTLIATLTQKAHEIATLVQNNVAATSLDSPDDLEISTLVQQLEGLKKLGYNPAIEQSKREIERQISNLRKAKLFKSSTEQNSYQLLNLILSIPDFWRSQKDEDLWRVYHTLVDYISIQNRQVTEVKLKL